MSDSASQSLWERALPCLLPSWRSQCSLLERGCAAARKRASSTLRDETGRGVCSGHQTPSLLSQLKESPRCLRGPVPPCSTLPSAAGSSRHPRGLVGMGPCPKHLSESQD